MNTNRKTAIFTGLFYGVAKTLGNHGRFFYTLNETGITWIDRNQEKES